jgi:serine/threonine-protein kinase RsbW
MTPVESVSVPGTAAGVARAATAFDEFCRRRDVPADARWRVQVALDEILSNIVKHGYQDGGGTIALAFSKDGRAITVEVIDTAPAFDPREAPAPDTTSPLETRRPGGLGVRFAEALVDELAYERRGEENHLRLTWHVRPGGAGTGPGKTDGNR